MASDHMTDVSLEADKGLPAFTTKPRSNSVITADKQYWIRELEWIRAHSGNPPVASSPRRRYSDFEWVRDWLIANFDGMFVPPLPEKKVMNQDTEFIKVRMAALGRWLDEILRNPYLSRDLVFRAFCTVPEGTAWDRFKKSPSSGTPSDNEGLTRWEAALSHLPKIEDSERICADLLKCVDSVERKLEVSVDALEVFVEKSASYARALTELTSTITETGKIAQLAAGVAIAAGPAATEMWRIGDWAVKTGKTFETWQDLATFQPRELQIFVLGSFRSELERLRALKETLCRRIELKQDYQKAWHAWDRANFDFKAAEGKSKPDKMAKLEAAIRTAKTTVDTCDVRFTNATKGLLHCEVGRRLGDTNTRLTTEFGQYASLAAATGLRTQQLWQDYIGTTGVRLEVMAKLAQERLAGESDIVTERTIADFAEEASVEVFGYGASIEAKAEEAIPRPTTTTSTPSAPAGRTRDDSDDGDNLYPSSAKPVSAPAPAPVAARPPPAPVVQTTPVPAPAPAPAPAAVPEPTHVSPAPSPTGGANPFDDNFDADADPDDAGFPPEVTTSAKRPTEELMDL